MAKKVKKLLDKSMYGMAIMSIAVCLVLMLAFYTFFIRSSAWLSHNMDVRANGMSVTSEVTANLIISEDIETVRNKIYMGEGTQEVDTPIGPVTLSAATRVNESLKTLSLDNVDPATGIMKAGAIYQDAVKDINYVETIVYIGTSGHDLYCSNIVAKFNNITISKDFLKSLSADILVNDSYKGTLRLSDISTGVSFGITKLTMNSPLKVTMRFYFDGALTNSSGKAIFRSASVDTTGINIGINFSAENPSE